jgi:hypothetical protein
MFQDLAAVAEIIGAIGVMVSLVFVGIQMMQANKLARAAAQQKQIESLRGISQLVMENPLLADILGRGPGAELTGSERVFVVAFMSYAERMWEGLYEQYRLGLVDPETWEAHRRQARAVQLEPLNQAVWKLRKHWYSDRYQKFRDTDDVRASADKLSYELDVPKPQSPASGQTPKP